MRAQHKKVFVHLAMDKGQVSKDRPYKKGLEKTKKIHPLGVSHYSLNALKKYVGGKLRGEEMYVVTLALLIADQGETLTLKGHQLSKYGMIYTLFWGRRRRRPPEISHVTDKCQHILKVEKIKGTVKDYRLTPNEIFFDGLKGHAKTSTGKKLNYYDFDFSQVKFYLDSVRSTLKSRE